MSNIDTIYRRSGSTPTNRRLFSLLFPLYCFGKLVHPVEVKGMGLRKWMEEIVILPAAFVTLLEYMLIWCKIKVIINQFP